MQVLISYILKLSGGDYRIELGEFTVRNNRVSIRVFASRASTTDRARHVSHGDAYGDA